MAASKVLRQAREAAGMTQKALGVALGYPEDHAQSFVSNWETEYRPIPRKHIKTLAALLNIDPLDLL